MTEIARFEARRRVKGSVVLSILIAVAAAVFTSFYPSMEAEIDLDEYAEAFPEVFREMFGVEALGSVEGFLATEVYQFVWVLLLGLYLAYLGAGTIAGDADADRLDVLLSLPVSRSRILLEKAASLAPVVVLPNVLVPPVVFASVVAVGYSIDVVDLLAVHALSIPYLAACAAVGVLVGVVVLDGDLARRIALGVVFALYLLDSLSTVADVEWLGAPSIHRYYDPTEILVDGTYDLSGAAVLVGMTGVLLTLAIVQFRRADAP